MNNQRFSVAIKATEKAITAEKAKLQRVLSDVALVMNTSEFIAKCRDIAIGIGESEVLMKVGKPSEKKAAQEKNVALNAELKRLRRLYSNVSKLFQSEYHIKDHISELERELFTLQKLSGAKAGQYSFSQLECL